MVTSRLPRITAQLANGAEAYVALERDLRERGPHGESTVAEIWRTEDRGRTWHPLPWRRSVRALLSRAAFAGWPPEWVNRMWLHDGRLAIEIREDGGPDSRMNPIWYATWHRGGWRVRFARHYDVAVDGPIAPASIELDLPGITTPPTFGPFR